MSNTINRLCIAIMLMFLHKKKHKELCTFLTFIKEIETNDYATLKSMTNFLQMSRYQENCQTN